MSTETSKPMPQTMPAQAIRARISDAYAAQSRLAKEEQWILESLSMVRRIVYKIVSYLSEADMEDLVSAGTVGLVQAARAYDPKSHAEFKTYAYIRIRGSVLDELRRRSFVPVAVHKQIKLVRQAYQEVVSATGVPPEDEVLAKRAGMSVKELYRTLQEARKQHFLSVHGLSDERPEMESLAPVDKSPAPDEQIQRKEMLTKMAEAISELSKRNRTILLLYYERELTMKEIAQVLDVTESRVSQLHASALFKLSMKLR